MEDLRRVNKFSFGEYVEPVGRVGGLTLWWTKEWNIQIRSKSRNHIEAIVKGENEWSFVGFYRAPKKKDRRRVFEDLQQICDVMLIPKLIAGDFNVIAHPNDKLGGLHFQWSQGVVLLDFIEQCKLQELEFRGSKFT